jgi:hypothetical protein
MTKCQIKVGYCSEWDSCLHADSKPSWIPTSKLLDN